MLSLRLPLFILVLALTACGGGNGGSGGRLTPPGGLNPGEGTYEPYACAPETRSEANGLRIYQVMTEAFIDTDGAGYGVGYGTSHHLGDLQGIKAALPYIRELGMNAIWLTPIFESRPISGQDLAATRLDATGYFATDYFSIDPQFGTLEDARALVDRAHELGMYVIFDGVFGHFKSNAYDILSPEGLQLRPGGERQGTTGREAQYPTDLDYFKEVARYWIETLKIDGWRLDQAYQVPVGAWGELRKVVDEASASVTYLLAGEETNPLGYMVGEVWKGETEIASEAYGSEAQPGLCSAFDFPMRYRIVQALAAEENATIFDRNASTLAEGYLTRDAYPTHAIPNGFLTNHDLLRFGDLLQRAGLAGPEDQEYWLRYQAAYAVLAAYTGPITLYYGEEIGEELAGFAARESDFSCADQGRCDDHVARTSGRIDGLAGRAGEPVFTLAGIDPLSQNRRALRDRIASLMALRAAHSALYEGIHEPIASGVGELVYADLKTSTEEQVLLLVNLGIDPVTTELANSQLPDANRLLDLESGAAFNRESLGYAVPLGPLQARFLLVE